MQGVKGFTQAACTEGMTSPPNVSVKPCWMKVILRQHYLASVHTLFTGASYHHRRASTPSPQYHVIYCLRFGSRALTRIFSFTSKDLGKSSDCALFPVRPGRQR